MTEDRAPQRHRRLVLIALAVLIVSCGRDVSSGELQGVVVDPPTEKPSFTLTDTDGEPYEGVLVRLQNVEVVEETATYFEFTVGDSTTPLLVDSDIYRYDTDSLAVGTCLDNLVGLMHRGYGGEG